VLSITIDAAGDPGFTIIPEDMDDFIEFELNDYKRRRQQARNGVMPPRKVPIHSDYKYAQFAERVIESEDAGGRYLPIILKPDFNPRASEAYKQESLALRSQPRVAWRPNGCPPPVVPSIF
jgi:hypothetical protein